MEPSVIEGDAPLPLQLSGGIQAAMEPAGNRRGDLDQLPHGHAVAMPQWSPAVIGGVTARENEQIDLRKYSGLRAARNG
jgi:hypothetical protein